MSLKGSCYATSECQIQLHKHSAEPGSSSTFAQTSPSVESSKVWRRVKLPLWWLRHPGSLSANTLMTKIDNLLFRRRRIEHRVQFLLAGGFHSLGADKKHRSLHLLQKMQWQVKEVKEFILVTLAERMEIVMQWNNLEATNQRQ